MCILGQLPGIYLEGGEPGGIKKNSTSIKILLILSFLFENVVSQATRSTLRCLKFQYFPAEACPQIPRPSLSTLSLATISPLRQKILYKTLATTQVCMRTYYSKLQTLAGN